MNTGEGARRRFRTGIRAAAAAGVAGAMLALAVQGCGPSRPDATSENGRYGLGSAADGPCTEDGARRSCSVETGRVGSVVNCFSGQQTCAGGSWGPCGGTSGTLSSVDLSLAGASLRGGTLSPLTVTSTAPSPEGGSCDVNPCNPYCFGIDTDAGALQTLAFTTTTIVGTVKGVTDFPGGANGPKNAMGANGHFVAAPDRITCSLQGPYPPADNSHCSSDFCCAAYAVGSSASTCQPWVVASGDNPTALSNCAKAPGVDFQVGLACQDTMNGHVHVPACNRGTGGATTGSLMVAEYAGNPKYSGDTDACGNAGTPSAFCTINLATNPIPSGKCIDLDVDQAFAGGTPGVTCSSLFSSGNRTMMINPPATAGYTTLAEGDPCNNYGFHPTTSQGGTCVAYGTQPPPPSALDYSYTASCPVGTSIAWNQFAYDTTLGNASDVVFEASTAPLLADGGTGTFTTPVTIAHPANPALVDPQVCPMSGPAPCPKNVNALLGGKAPVTMNQVLKIGVILTAKSAIPTVNSWKVTYSCVPTE